MNHVLNKLQGWQNETNEGDKATKLKELIDAISTSASKNNELLVTVQGVLKANMNVVDLNCQAMEYAAEAQTALAEALMSSWETLNHTLTAMS